MLNKVKQFLNIAIPVANISKLALKAQHEAQHQQPVTLLDRLIDRWIDR